MVKKVVTGDIWLVNFQNVGVGTRPAIILADIRNSVLCTPLTSSANRIVSQNDNRWVIKPDEWNRLSRISIVKWNCTQFVQYPQLEKFIGDCDWDMVNMIRNFLMDGLK